MASRNHTSIPILIIRLHVVTRLRQQVVHVGLLVHCLYLYGQIIDMILVEFDPILENICILVQLLILLRLALILLHLAVVLQLLHRQHATPQRVQKLLNRLEDVQQVHELAIVGVEVVDGSLRKEKLHVRIDTTADVSHHNLLDFGEEFICSLFELFLLLLVWAQLLLFLLACIRSLLLFSLLLLLFFLQIHSLLFHQLLIEQHRSRFTDFLNEFLVLYLQSIDKFFDF